MISEKKASSPVYGQHNAAANSADANVIPYKMKKKITPFAFLAICSLMACKAPSQPLQASQIIKPEISHIINTFYYDKSGNELRCERTENGATEETERVVYEFDQYNRVIKKQTFNSQELMSLEIRIYD